MEEKSDFLNYVKYCFSLNFRVFSDGFCSNEILKCLSFDYPSKLRIKMVCLF